MTVKLKDELEGLFEANIPLINLVTYEEQRVMQTLTELAGDRMGVHAWDLADGFACIHQGEEALPEKECTTETILPFIENRGPKQTVFVLKDFHHSWNRKRDYITRKLRNMRPGLRTQGKFIVMITPAAELPAELRDDVVVVRVPLPDAAELETLFAGITRNLDEKLLPPPPVREKLIASCLGLTTNQAQLAFSRVFAKHRKFDERAIEMLTWSKQEIIRESEALEYWPAEFNEARVGGLDLLKAWLKKRETAFSSEAREAGLPFPRGVALIGIPGTGKSLSAKMTAGLWRLPLLRLDVGAVFGSLLGQSEENIRRAIQLAETVSPCILWVDEMEKAFAGSSPGVQGNAAALRVFGTFLTWMQEHESPVFVIATANDVGGLAPELLSRFDRVFFLDLPNEEERRAIFEIHLKRAGELFPDQRLGVAELVEETRGFVGREIERIVHEAHFTAFADGNREIEQADLKAALTETIPISRSHAEVVNELREWKRDGRAFPASTEQQAAQAQAGMYIEPE